MRIKMHQWQQTRVLQKRQVTNRPHRLMKTSSNSSRNVAINILKWLHHQTNDKALTYACFCFPAISLICGFLCFPKVAFCSSIITISFMLQNPFFRLLTSPWERKAHKHYNSKFLALNSLIPEKQKISVLSDWTAKNPQHGSKQIRGI